jgi:hypothetical protein
MSLQNRPDRPHLVLTERPPSDGRYLSLRDTFEHQVEVLLKTWQPGHPDVAPLLRSHGLASGSNEGALRAGPSPERARALVAKEHGVRDWEEVAERSELKIDARFEAAGDAVVGGALDALQTLLRETPELARARSTRRGSRRDSRSLFSGAAMPKSPRSRRCLSTHGRTSTSSGPTQRICEPS